MSKEERKVAKKLSEKYKYTFPKITIDNTEMDPDDQIEKIQEELNEVTNALIIKSCTVDDMLLECFDVIQAMETFMRSWESLAYNSLTDIKNECINKNNRRGYYGSRTDIS